MAVEVGVFKERGEKLCVEEGEKRSRKLISSQKRNPSWYGLEDTNLGYCQSMEL